MIAYLKGAILGLCGTALLSAAAAVVTTDLAAAADPRRGPIIDNRALIEQNIRRDYNNYNRNVPTDPLGQRLRERHLQDAPANDPQSLRRDFQPPR